MKLPKINKYFSINIFFYVFFLQVLSLHSMFKFWIGSNFDYLWIPFLPIFAITTLLIPINILFIFIEIFLRRLKILKSENIVTIPIRTKKIIYSLTVIAFIYFAWFWICYYPNLSKQLQFD